MKEKKGHERVAVDVRPLSLNAELNGLRDKLCRFPLKIVFSLFSILINGRAKGLLRSLKLISVDKQKLII